MPSSLTIILQKCSLRSALWDISEHLEESCYSLAALYVSNLPSRCATFLRGKSGRICSFEAPTHRATRVLLGKSQGLKGLKGDSEWPLAAAAEQISTWMCGTLAWGCWSAADRQFTCRLVSPPLGVVGRWSDGHLVYASLWISLHICLYLCGWFRVFACLFVRPFSLCFEFMSEDTCASSISDAHVF